MQKSFFNFGEDIYLFKQLGICYKQIIADLHNANDNTKEIIRGIVNANPHYSNDSYTVRIISEYKKTKK